MFLYCKYIQIMFYDKPLCKYIQIMFYVLYDKYIQIMFYVLYVNIHKERKNDKRQ